MSVRHVQALVMGFTQSGKTTLITRWVTGRLPTEDTKTLPFNGVKSINIRSKKHHTKELVVVRFVDGSDVSDDALRRLCYSADVIVACMCVELNGLDESTIEELNYIFTTRRPPIIVLGTMLDLRYNIQPLQLPESFNTSDTEHMADEENVPTGELTVEDVTKHRVSFSASKDNRKAGDPVDTGIASEEEQSDVNERIMASITESDGNTDLDMSSISIDIQTSGIRKKDPAYCSTESINGSLVTKLDESHDSWSEINAEDKVLNDGGVTLASSVPEEDLTQRLAAAKNPGRAPATNTISSDSDDHHENAAKSEIEQTTLSTEDVLSGLNTSSGYMNTQHGQDGLSPLSASTPHPSVLPEDRNFHVNLDADPVRLADHDPKQLSMQVNINGYCKEWSVADGLRLAKTVKGDTYMECSACTGQNLQEVFEYIARVGSKYNKKKNDKCSVS